MKKLLIVAIGLSLVTTAGPAFAKKNVKKKAHAKIHTIAKYSPRTGKRLMMSADNPKLFRSLLKGVASEFKLHANPKQICEMFYNRIECHDDYENGTCPSEVTVELKDERHTRMNVDVNCTGPNANGECDCEFDQ